ncbi:AraC family transcriptional regulator ligand-binding domain-containing protein [Marmoricola sp. RAF53]|uniref:AraC family transcriptional regulator n=1 Tax=Marmoricola sp. RAF53 TaxID=3233059 RepID=UPI003F9AC08F
MSTGSDGFFMRAWVLHGLAEVVEEFGGDPAAYERRFHLSLQRTDHGQDLVPARLFVQLLEACAADFGCPDFGLRVGLAHWAEPMGPVTVAVQQSATVRDAYVSGIRYLNLLNPALGISMTDTPEGLRTTYARERLGHGDTRQFQEWIVAIAVNVLRVLAGPDARLGGVRFSQEPLLPVAHYEEVFGCSASFGEDDYGVDYRASDLARLMNSNNPELKALLTGYLDQIIASSELGLEHQIMALIRELLPTGGCTLAVIAPHQFVSVRTLQRRLAAKGLVFERMVDDVRREQAMTLLKDPTLPASDIAGLLGYVEQSSFSHAFRRWTGMSPRAWRAQQAALG